MISNEAEGHDLRSERIAVFGAGAFGQALAAAALLSRHQPTLFAPKESDLRGARENGSLRGCEFVAMDTEPGYWRKTGQELPGLIVMAVPAQALRQATTWVQSAGPEGAVYQIVIASKGIERKTLMLPHEVVLQILGTRNHVASLSGPSFAKEIVQGLPTSVVCASHEAAFVKRCALLLHRPNFRIYSSRDIVGVQVGGALKNVIALVAGAADGLGLGHNARAAVITRGLGEVTQVGVALGADPMTFLGLSGLGDLVLTCTGELSRNRSFGIELAKGRKPSEIIESLGQVVEGYTTAESAYELSRKYGLDTPIIDAVYEVLYKDRPIGAALDALGRREQKEEFEWLRT